MSKKDLSLEESGQSTPGDRIKFIRNELGLNQSEFGKHIGLKAGMISALEKNRNNPSFQISRRLVKEYNVNLYYLFLGEGRPFRGKFDSVLDNITDELNPESFEAFIKDLARSGFLQIEMMGLYRRLKQLSGNIIEKEIQQFSNKEESELP